MNDSTVETVSPALLSKFLRTAALACTKLRVVCTFSLELSDSFDLFASADLALSFEVVVLLYFFDDAFSLTNLPKPFDCDGDILARSGDNTDHVSTPKELPLHS